MVTVRNANLKSLRIHRLHLLIQICSLGTLKVLAMALESSLWGTLLKEILQHVFARLSVTGIGQLRVLSKEWKWNIDCKDSEFNRVFDATTHLKMVAVVSWTENGDETFVDLYEVQADKWQFFEEKVDFTPVIKTSTADGGLCCIPRQWNSAEWPLQIVVVNPLTQKKMKLPPLLSMGVGKSDVRVEMVQLTMDRKTKEYKLHVVGYMKTGGNGLFAQVYDSHIKEWSLVESREGRIIGWGHADHSLAPMFPCVYNCADGNLQRFNRSDIAPGLEVETDCMQLINDHLFVLHKEATPSSTNLMQDGESDLLTYCISEFHLPEKATAWVKLGVHKCDPSIYDIPEEPYEWALLACNGFLLVRCTDSYGPEYNSVWLYNLSTCVWHNSPHMGLIEFCNMMLCEISWSALP